MVRLTTDRPADRCNFCRPASLLALPHSFVVQSGISTFLAVHFVMIVVETSAGPDENHHEEEMHIPAVILQSSLLLLGPSGRASWSMH